MIDAQVLSLMAKSLVSPLLISNLSGDVSSERYGGMMKAEVPRAAPPEG